uniref:Putative secreted protein n=1 Tax=Anopheles triannulatus TaxID=58253 RepID=A0A2M4B428_9DIPT
MATSLVVVVVVPFASRHASTLPKIIYQQPAPIWPSVFTVCICSGRLRSLAATENKKIPKVNTKLRTVFNNGFSAQSASSDVALARRVVVRGSHRECLRCV